MSDPLWSEFAPLWTAIASVKPPIIVAGGYGLYLKQLWLLSQGVTATSAIPLSQWTAFAPRATQDIDLVLDLDVVADEAQQAVITRAIRAQGYTDASPLWQFAKDVGAGRVKIELHSVPPPDGHLTVKQDGRFSIKRRASTSPDRLHTRANVEAVGGHLAVCRFPWLEHVIHVPNPVTWSVMKLTAAADRWAEANDPAKDPGKREVQRKQALKHAVDTGRIIALMQVEERDAAESVLAAIRGTAAYQRVCGIQHEHTRPGGFIAEAMRTTWTAPDIQVISRVIATWFPAAS